MGTVHELRKVYIELSQVTRNIQSTHTELSSGRMAQLKGLFDDRSWKVFWQGMNDVCFSLGGGVSQITGAAIGGDLKDVLEAIGKVLPNAGQAANTFIRSEEVLLEGEISENREHVKQILDGLERDATESLRKFGEALGQLAREEDQQFQIRG
ncbi:MAG: hypothetical protein HYX48_05655 [Chlamydiales bacterium]|nr:hypothetical protein [Chlamydiales bacterium]